ncbi:MAG: hypothetical protein H0X25_21940, partial [Acidobacteriales bacterium]|nr:hypothetical protein [Terriglobales bacterium]
YAQHLYQRPEVHIKVTDGRSFVRNTPQRFDVVQMTLVDTWASTAAGAFALSENNLYTTEAFQEYFQHLTPEGMIAVTRWEFRQPREALRVVSVAMEALHRLGVADTSRHFIVVSEGDLNEDGIPVVVLAKRSPFTAAEENQVSAHLAKYPKLAALYLPSQPGDNPFSKLIASNDAKAFSRSYAYDVTPVTDNAPFFFFTLKAREFLKAASFQHAIDWKVNLGVAILAVLLGVSIGAVLLFLIGPMLVRGLVPGERPARLLYFVAIGLGYVLVEIALIQRFVLFLGHPTYALTVVIFLLLLSSGVGSLLSRELRRILPAGFALLLIAALIFCLVAVLPPILQALVGLSLITKLAISGILMVPLGLLMGMPFPAGLQALVEGGRNSAENLVEWAWAVNAASTVLGSVLAMVFAIAFGLNFTLFGGAIAYLCALALLSTLRPVSAAHPA